MPDVAGPLSLHASAVSIESNAVVIVGASGRGKSSLALQLMAMGASLVGDDQLLLHRDDDELWARPAERLVGLIEARGVGILQAAAQYPCRVRLCVDMDRLETERLPHRYVQTWLGLSVPSLRKVDGPAFPAAILQYLKAGRSEV